MNKFERLKVGRLLQPLEIPKAKLESISMDFIVGHNSLRIIVNLLTKMCQFVPTKTIISSPKLARLIVESVYWLYGKPTNIVGEQDCKIDSHFLRAIFQNLGTLLILSTADHCEIDGQRERVIQLLKYMLRAYLSKHQSNWEDYLPILEFAYNSAKDVSWGFSPFMLRYGVQP